MDRFSAAYPGYPLETAVVRTEGDVDKTSPLTVIGGRGVFTNDIEAAILGDRVEAGVHSAKDLPSTLHPAVPIVAFPDRDDPRDVLVSRHGTTLDRLPDNPTIGTSSRRREAQVRRLRPDARTVSIRGNIDTRLRKAEGPEFDAIVLAAAGVRRMGWDDRISESFAVERLVPSPGQGAIAVQAKAGSDVAALLQTIDDAAVSIPVLIERAFLQAIGAGCAMPVGAHASAVDGGYRLVGMLADESGNRIAFADDALTLGEERRHAAEIATRLRTEVGLENGPAVWNGWAQSADPLKGARVVVTRPRRQAGPLVAALAERGATVLLLPAIRIEAMTDTSTLDAALVAVRQGHYRWLVFTSANAVEIVTERLAALGMRREQLRGPRVAAVGAATARAAATAGFVVSDVALSPQAEGLAEILIPRMEPGDRVLYPRSAMGREVIPEALRRAGAEVVTIDAYRTLPETTIEAGVLDQVRRGEIDVITFSSPSGVRGVLDLLGGDRGALRSVRVVCAGPVTAAAACTAGLQIDAVSDDPGVEGMVEAIASLLGDRLTPAADSEPATSTGSASALAPERAPDSLMLVGRSAQ
jgi:hydroxymethylbilane synthase